MAARRKRTFRRKRRFGASKLNARQKAQVKRLIAQNEEHKQYDVIVGAQSMSAAWQISGPYTIPAQGNTALTRVGDIIEQKRFDIHGVFTVASADVYNTVRMVVFKWAQNSAAGGPTAVDIFQDTVSLPLFSRLNDTSIEGRRFKVLMDRTYNLNINGTAVRGFRRSFYGRGLGAKKQTFNPGLQTGFNSIYIAFCSDSIAAVHPTYQLTSRLTYTDA